MVPPESRRDAAPAEGQGWPRDRRLLRRSDYLEIYRVGRKVFGRFVVVFGVRTSKAAGRLGVTATKKVGSSVIRNRARRRIREIVRRRRAVPFDVVVNVREGADTAPFEDVRRDLERALDRLSGEHR